MASDVSCCNLVGDLVLGLDGCIVSISSSCNPEITICGEEVLMGPNIGTISITGYAKYTDDGSPQIYKGCPGSASISIPWIRKYDCVNDIVYFIPAGEGQSNLIGDGSYGEDTPNFVSLKGGVLQGDCLSFNASSSSGPTTIYTKEIQKHGWGLKYEGSPISFETDEEGGLSTTIFDSLDVGAATAYMQSFSITFEPGNIAIANYSFTYQVQIT